MSKYNYTEIEFEEREKIIFLIEGITGTLESIPYNLISTDDLQKILDCLREEKTQDG